MPNTVASYRAPLEELFQLAFGVDITSTSVCKLFRALFHLWPAHALPEPSWSLDWVLSFSLFSLVCCGPFGSGLFCKGSFLVGMCLWGTGCGASCSSSAQRFLFFLFLVVGLFICSRFLFF